MIQSSISNSNSTSARTPISLQINYTRSPSPQSYPTITSPTSTTGPTSPSSSSKHRQKTHSDHQRPSDPFHTQVSFPLPPTRPPSTVIDTHPISRASSQRSTPAPSLIVASPSTSTIHYLFPSSESELDIPLTLSGSKSAPCSPNTSRTHSPVSNGRERKMDRREGREQRDNRDHRWDKANILKGKARPATIHEELSGRRRSLSIGTSTPTSIDTPWTLHSPISDQFIQFKQSSPSPQSSSASRLAAIPPVPTVKTIKKATSLRSTRSIYLKQSMSPATTSDSQTLLGKGLPMTIAESSHALRPARRVSSINREHELKSQHANGERKSSLKGYIQQDPTPTAGRVKVMKKAQSMKTLRRQQTIDIVQAQNRSLTKEVQQEPSTIDRSLAGLSQTEAPRSHRRSLSLSSAHHDSRANALGSGQDSPILPAPDFGGPITLNELAGSPSYSNLDYSTAGTAPSLQRQNASPAVFSRGQSQWRLALVQSQADADETEPRSVAMERGGTRMGVSSVGAIKRLVMEDTARRTATLQGQRPQNLQDTPRKSLGAIPSSLRRAQSLKLPFQSSSTDKDSSQTYRKRSQSLSANVTRGRSQSLASKSLRDMPISPPVPLPRPRSEVFRTHSDPSRGIYLGDLNVDFGGPYDTFFLSSPASGFSGSTSCFPNSTPSSAYQSLPQCEDQSGCKHTERGSEWGTQWAMNDGMGQMKRGPLHPALGSESSLLAPSTVGLDYSPISTPATLPESLKAEAIDLTVTTTRSPRSSAEKVRPSRPSEDNAVRLLFESTTAHPFHATTSAQPSPQVEQTMVQDQPGNSLQLQNTFYLPPHDKPATLCSARSLGFGGLRKAFKVVEGQEDGGHAVRDGSKAEGGRRELGIGRPPRTAKSPTRPGLFPRILPKSPKSHHPPQTPRGTRKGSKNFSSFSLCSPPGAVEPLPTMAAVEPGADSTNATLTTPRRMQKTVRSHKSTGFLSTRDSIRGLFHRQHGIQRDLANEFDARHDLRGSQDQVVCDEKGFEDQAYRHRILSEALSASISSGLHLAGTVRLTSTTSRRDDQHHTAVRRMREPRTPSGGGKIRPTIPHTLLSPIMSESIQPSPDIDAEVTPTAPHQVHQETIGPQVPEYHLERPKLGMTRSRPVTPARSPQWIDSGPSESASRTSPTRPVSRWSPSPVKVVKSKKSFKSFIPGGVPLLGPLLYTKSSENLRKNGQVDKGIISKPSLIRPLANLDVETEPPMMVSPVVPLPTDQDVERYETPSKQCLPVEQEPMDSPLRAINIIPPTGERVSSVLGHHHPTDGDETPSRLVRGSVTAQEDRAAMLAHLGRRPVSWGEETPDDQTSDPPSEDDRDQSDQDSPSRCKTQAGLLSPQFSDPRSPKPPSPWLYTSPEGDRSKLEKLDGMTPRSQRIRKGLGSSTPFFLISALEVPPMPSLSPLTGRHLGSTVEDEAGRLTVEVQPLSSEDPLDGIDIDTPVHETPRETRRRSPILPSISRMKSTPKLRLADNPRLRPVSSRDFPVHKVLDELLKRDGLDETEESPVAPVEDLEESGDGLDETPRLKSRATSAEEKRKSSRSIRSRPGTPPAHVYRTRRASAARSPRPESHLTSMSSPYTSRSVSPAKSRNTTGGSRRESTQENEMATLGVSGSSAEPQGDDGEENLHDPNDLRVKIWLKAVQDGRSLREMEDRLEEFVEGERKRFKGIVGRVTIGAIHPR